MTPPLSTLKLRVTRASRALAEAKVKLKEAEDLVDLRQDDLNEALVALDDAKYPKDSIGT